MSFWKFITPVAATAAGVIVVAALKTKSAAEKLISEISDVHWKGFFGHGLINQSIEIDVEFTFTNPTNTDMTIRNIFLEIFAGGSKIGTIRMPNPNLKIDKNAVTKHVFTMRSMVINIAGAIIQALWNRQIPDTIFIKGSITVNDFKTDYNESYPLKDLTA